MCKYIHPFYGNGLWVCVFYRSESASSIALNGSRSIENNFIDQIQCLFFSNSFSTCLLLSSSYFWSERHKKMRSERFDFTVPPPFLSLFIEISFLYSNVSSCQFYWWIKAICLCMNRKRLNVYFALVEIIGCSLLMMMFDIKFYVSEHVVWFFCCFSHTFTFIRPGLLVWDLWFFLIFFSQMIFGRVCKRTTTSANERDRENCL